ncbi:hypothetical protein BH10BAC2_BH10BAC2_33800 [soil metagenome]
MQEKKAHHYVPQAYLKHFGFEKEKNQFFVHRLRMPEMLETDIKDTHVKNVCVQNKLYTLPGATPQERNLVEDFYSDAYEKHYDSIYKKLVDATVDDINDENRRVIIGMVVSLFYRNPYWHDFHNKIISDMFERAFYLSKQNGKDSFFWNDEEISIKGKTVEEMKKEYNEENRPLLVITQTQAAINLLKLRLDSDGINITKTTDGNHQYLTSDRPVNIMDPDNKQLIPMNPLNFLTLPIDSNHLLSLIPGCHPTMRYKIIRDKSENFYLMLAHNIKHAQKANNFLFGSEVGLKTFARLMQKLKNK